MQLYSPWYSPGQNIGMGRLSLLQGIFPSQCYTKYASKFGKLSTGHRTGKSQFYYSPKERQCHNTALISHATSKVMLKILHTRLQQYMNCELPDVQVGFRKGRGTRDQIANIHWIIEKSTSVPEKQLFLLY